MPRIPFAPKPDMPNHVSDSVPMSGAPGMGFKMEEGEALKQFGRSIGEAGRAVGNAMADFSNKLTDTRNNLAAAEAQSLYTKQCEELRSRMAQNPASYKDFAQWSSDNETAFDEAAKPILERMSPNFRKAFEARMSGVRAHQSGEVERFGMHAQISAELDRYKALKAEYAKTGDAEAYKALVEHHSGVLISKEQADLDMLDYPRLAESGEVARLIASDPETALKKLKERGGQEGDFVHFKHLPLDYRNSVTRSASVAAAAKQNEFCQNLIAHYNETGQLLFSNEALAEMHKEGQLSDELYNRAATFNKHFLAEMSARESRAAKARDAAADRAAAVFTLQTLYSDDGRRRLMTDGEVDLVCQRAFQLFKDHPKKALSLVKTIRAEAARIQKQNDPFSTPGGKEVLRYLKNQQYYYVNPTIAYGLKLGTEEGDETLAPFKERGDKNQFWDFSHGFDTEQYLNCYAIAEEMLGQGKSPREVIDALGDSIDKLHRGAIRNIMKKNFGK